MVTGFGALESLGSGEAFRYLEHVYLISRNFLRASEVENFCTSIHVLTSNLESSSQTLENPIFVNINLPCLFVFILYFV